MSCRSTQVRLGGFFPLLLPLLLLLLYYHRALVLWSISAKGDGRRWNCKSGSVGDGGGDDQDACERRWGGRGWGYQRTAADIMLICERGCTPDKPGSQYIYKSPSAGSEAQGPHALNLKCVYARACHAHCVTVDYLALRYTLSPLD